MALKLKLKYSDKAEIPAEHESLYVERDGSYFLEVEGAVDKGHLDEFRNQNLALQKELESVRAKYKGIDPEAITRLEEKQRKAAEAQALKEGQLDQIVAGRLKPFQEQLAEQRAANEKLLQELSTVKINNAAIAAATKRGIRPTAIPDLASRARTVFRLDTYGKPIPYEGDAVRFGRDGITPMTVDEWAENLVSEAPHLFEPSAGSGASGNCPGGVNHGETNPWSKQHWNLTRQGEIVRNDPGLGERLKKAARK